MGVASSGVIIAREFKSLRKPICIALVDTRGRVICIPRRLVRIGYRGSNLLFLPLSLVEQYIVKTDVIPSRAVMKYIPVFVINYVETRMRRSHETSRYFIGVGKIRAVYTGDHFIAMTADKSKCTSPITCLEQYPSLPLSGIRGVIYFKREGLFLTLDDYTKEFFKNYRKFYKCCKCRLLQLVSEFPIYVCSSFIEVADVSVIK